MSRARDLASGAANVFTANDNTKLDGIETAATADQTNTEIRTAVEAASDSNVFTDADHTKLNGIEAGADVTDATNVAAAGAAMLSGATFTGTTGIQSASPELHLIDTTNNTDAIIRSNNNGDIVLEADENSERDNTIIRFDVDSSEKMRLTSAGLLGVGTNSPSTAIDCVGAGVPFTVNSNNSNQYKIQLKDAGSVRSYLGASSSASFVVANSSVSEAMRITSGGLVAIGNSTPDSFNANAKNLVVGTGSGSNGISIFAGNSSDSAIFFADNGSTATGQINYKHADNAFTFHTNSGTERVRIDSNGNVGIGTASPNVGLDVKSSSQAQIGIGSTSAGGALLLLDGDSNGDFSGADYSFIEHDTNGRLNIVQDSPSGTNQLRLYTAATERMRIDEDDILFGTTTTSLTDAGIKFANLSTTHKYAVFTHTASSANESLLYINRQSSDGTAIFFRRANTNVGSISVTTSNTSYNTSSDRRLKSNIQDAASASAKIDAMKVRQFDWNVDGSHQDYGLIAQELQPIEPLAVTGDADSDEMMGVDYSKLVPMLLKEIQDLRGRVATLEAA